MEIPKKFIHLPCIERQRVPLPKEEVLEFHRNCRVELYDNDFLKGVKESIDWSQLARYPDVDRFLNRLSKHLNYDKTQLLLTSGLDGGIRTVFENCTRPGSKAILIEPTYMMYSIYAKAYGVELKKLYPQKNDFTIGLERLLECIDSSIEVVFLPNPHEPIESMFSLNELRVLAEHCQQLGVLLFVDEAYFGFGAPTAMPLIGEYGNVLVGRTFSKALGMPAIRLGYLAGNQSLITYLESRRFAYESNSLSLSIAEWVLDNFERFEDYIKAIAESRKWVKAALANSGIHCYCKHSISALVDVNTSSNAVRLVELLRRKKIWVRTVPAPAENYILMTLGEKKTMQRIFPEFLNAYNEVVERRC